MILSIYHNMDPSLIFPFAVCMSNGRGAGTCEIETHPTRYYQQAWEELSHSLMNSLLPFLSV